MGNEPSGIDRKGPPPGFSSTVPGEIDGGPRERAASSSAKAREPASPFPGESDQYSAAVVNQVLKNLKSLLSFRLDRPFASAPRRDLKSGEKELTPFEKAFLARFEEGKVLEQPMGQGPGRFLRKSEKAWKEFFLRFLPFTQGKKGRVADLREMIYRGLIKEIAGIAGFLVSDLKFVEGGASKFARLEVRGEEILKRLEALMPGDVIAQALVAELLGGPEFAYQALSHRIINPELAQAHPSAATESYQSPAAVKEAALSQGRGEVRQGIALSARTEQLIARQLELDVKLPVRPMPQRGELPSEMERPRWQIFLIYLTALSALGFLAYAILRMAF